MDKSVKYGIVILNYNTYTDTIACIDSAKEYQQDYNIYIVDNGSQDGSGKQLQKKYEDDGCIDVLLADKNYGFSGGNNIGIQKAIADGCKYVFLLNSDIILLNDAISCMASKLENDPDIVAIGPAVYGSDGDYQQFARKGITLKSYLIDKNIVEKVYPGAIEKARGFSYNKENDFEFPGMVSGCCFGLRADFITEHNCLDDRLFLYYEEDALAHIIAMNEKKCSICAAAKVLHNEGQATEKTMGTQKAAFVRLYRWTSVMYVLWKYAKVNRGICYILGRFNILVWGVLSIRDVNYRTLFKKFRYEMKRVLATDEK